MGPHLTHALLFVVCLHPSILHQSSQSSQSWRALCDPRDCSHPVISLALFYTQRPARVSSKHTCRPAISMHQPCIISSLIHVNDRAHGILWRHWLYTNHATVCGMEQLATQNWHRIMVPHASSATCQQCHTPAVQHASSATWKKLTTGTTAEQTLMNLDHPGFGKIMPLAYQWMLQWRNVATCNALISEIIAMCWLADALAVHPGKKLLVSISFET